MSDQEDDFELSDLDDKELVEQIQDDLYDGLNDEVFEGVEILLERKWDANDILGDALVGGMKIVGEDFRDGILFVPEVAATRKPGNKLVYFFNQLYPSRIGIGVGKNLVGMMLEGAGFEVIDLGINNPVENYLEAIDEHKPVIMGMSALLTTTMPYMGVVIEELDKRGMRNDFHVMCGGAPLNQEFADAIGADAYGRDAARSAEMAQAYAQGIKAA